MTRHSMISIAAAMIFLGGPVVAQDKKEGLNWLKVGPDLREAKDLPNGAVARLGPKGWPARVLAFSKDGKQFVTAHNTHAGGEPANLVVWDTATGLPIHQLKTAEIAYLSAAFSPDGKMLAAGGMSNTLFNWDLTTGKSTGEGTPFKGHVYSIAFTPNGKTLVVGTTGLHLLSLDLKEKAPELPGAPTNYVSDVQVSPDGQRLVTLTPEGIELWDLEHPKRVAVLLNKTDSGYPHIAFSADGDQVIVARWIDGHVKRWKAKDGTAIGDWKKVFPVSPRDVVFSPDDRLVALGGEHCNDTQYKKVILCELATGKKVAEIKMPSVISSLRFAPDGKTLAVGTDRGDLSLWKSDGTLVQTILTAPQPVIGMYFPDNTKLISVSADSLVHVWGLTKFEKQKRGQFVLNPKDVPLQVSPGGKFLATTTREGTLRLWDTADGKQLWAAGAVMVARKLPVVEVKPPIEAPKAPEPFPTFVLTFSQDGKTVAARTGEETVSVWKGADGKLVQSVKTGVVPYCLAVSAKWLLVGPTAHDDAVRLFDLSSGKEAGRLPLKAPGAQPGGESRVEVFVDALHLAPDGKTLLVIERIETTLLNAPIPPGAPAPKFTTYQGRFWDLPSKESGEVITNLVTSTAAFSADGKLLALNRSTHASNAAQDHGLAIWDLAQKKQVGFGFVPGDITGIAFSPDVRFIVTHGLDYIYHGIDASILLWDVAELRKLSKTQ